MTEVFKQQRQLPPLMDNGLEAIGNTPLIRLDRFRRKYGIECDVYGKIEFYNTSGSVKDRIAMAMIETAEREGRIKPGDTLVEPTSGNTGIAMAMACAMKGYKCIITMSERMSPEKIDIMQSFGATVIRTPGDAVKGDYEHFMTLARRLAEENPGYHVLDQYGNPNNPEIHGLTTANEIIQQVDGELDAFVATCGTGGTITGVSRRLKQHYKHCKIWGVDPHGSIMAQPDSLNYLAGLKREIEGIGYEFVPDVLDRSTVDEWVKTHDKETFNMCRDFIQLEGLLIGGSSGSALCGAMRIARGMKKGQKLVVILADSCRNYMGKFLSDNWMIEKGFMPPPRNHVESALWGTFLIRDLGPGRKPICVSDKTTCRDAIQLMTSAGVRQVPVINDKREFTGILDQRQILTQLRVGTKLLTDSVHKFKDISVEPTYDDTPLSVVSRVLEIRACAVVCGNATNPIPVRLVTSSDLLGFLADRDTSAARAKL